MNIFEKGNFQPVADNFRSQGILLLRSIADFQKQHDSPDTDTTINQVRDCLVAYYLGYELLNTEKHGFDAKKIGTEQFLEIKQCSTSSQSLGGTWNDTSEDKALAFSDKRLFTVVAVWDSAADLLCMIYGQSPELGAHLLRLVVNRKEGSRSTQSISISKLICEFGFFVICPPGKDKSKIYEFLAASNTTLAKHLELSDLKGIKDV